MIDSPLLSPAGHFIVANVEKLIKFAFTLAVFLFILTVLLPFAIKFFLLAPPSQALATMTIFILCLLFLSSLYTTSLAAVTAHKATNSTFDVFKYVDQLIGTNNYGRSVPSTF